jgi:hypothetical protein
MSRYDPNLANAPGHPGEFSQSVNDDEYLRGLIKQKRFEQYGMLERCRECKRKCKMYNAPAAVIVCRRQIAEIAYRLRRQPTVADLGVLLREGGGDAAGGR